MNNNSYSQDWYQSLFKSSSLPACSYFLKQRVLSDTYSMKVHLLPLCNFHFIIFQLHLTSSHSFAMKQWEQNFLSDLFQIIQYMYLFTCDLIYLLLFLTKQSHGFHFFINLIVISGCWTIVDTSQVLRQSYNILFEMKWWRTHYVQDKVTHYVENLRHSFFICICHFVCFFLHLRLKVKQGSLLNCSYQFSKA